MSLINTNKTIYYDVGIRYEPTYYFVNNKNNIKIISHNKNKKPNPYVKVNRNFIVVYNELVYGMATG